MNPWLKNRNIIKYAIRQAQSCDYLEDYFNSFLRDDQDENRQVLLDKLITCHRRQKGDIKTILSYIPNRKGGSFYFDKMRKKNTNPMYLLSIQYISYLRGKKRYSLLKDYDIKDNEPFREIWKKFYSDAHRNADMTLDYLIEKWGVKVMFVIIFLQIKERFLIWKINRYNETN